MVLRRASRAMEGESMIEWMDDGVGDLLFLGFDFCCSGGISKN
jgi:hypothetical protein